MLAVLAAPPPTHAQPVAQAAPCYVVSDTGDSLFHIDRPLFNVALVGGLGAGRAWNVEGIALSLDGQTLYAVDDRTTQGIFGTINLTTGAFTAIGPVGPGTGIDPATGLVVSHNLNDVDSLATHPWTGELWAATRQSGTSPDNVLFRINPQTGQVVPDTFGPGLDFAFIQLPAGNRDVDDLAIDPTTGIFYITSNISGAGDDFEHLGLDPFDPPNSVGFQTNHYITTVNRQPIMVGAQSLDDVEGLAFDNLGNLFATTGREWDVLDPAHFFWQIDKATALATPRNAQPIGSFGTYGDVEAVDCLSGGLNLKAGVVFSDANGNGVFDAGDTPFAGATVRYYRDNGNGTFDGPASADVLVQTKVTDASGAYEFQVAALGTFFAVVDAATLPPGVSLTTPGLYTVAFTDVQQAHQDNDFGFNPGGAPTPTPAPSVTPGGPTPPPGTLQTYDPRLSKLGPGGVVPGEIITFSIVARNAGAGTLTNAVVTDNVPAEFFSEVVEASATRGAVTVSGLTVRVVIGTMPPGDAVTITIRARVRLDVPPPQSATNVATFDTTEAARQTASAVIALATLPQTGYPPTEPPRGWAESALPLALGTAVLGGALVGLRRRRAAR